MVVSTAWQITRGPGTSSTTGVWNVLCDIHQEQKKWWENVMLIRVRSRRTAMLTWAASLAGPLLWTAATFTRSTMYLQFLSFYIIYVHRFCSSPRSNSVSYEMQSDPILVLYGWQFSLNFGLLCLTRKSSIMHILPLPPCRLYSIRAQNGYGPVSYTHLTLPTICSV